MPRKHIEEVPVGDSRSAATSREITPENTVPVAQSMRITNTRRRADQRTTEQQGNLDTLDMRR
ncbi:hypothetical protein [Streptomyces cadmiisoli]|uniref:Uncharacterized protein n=1 Tax=Streptomyces cadmiisoli TaxID=2184053 RepID=A0A2Z4JD24_9ACTN|nr:hypothetical protein [Streptomyces cadmiisoli]AWW43015.1 hypothetical protein DN051_40945 [Streptomyces cadmiisoli]